MEPPSLPWIPAGFPSPNLPWLAFATGSRSLIPSPTLSDNNLCSLGRGASSICHSVTQWLSHGRGQGPFIYGMCCRNCRAGKLKKKKKNPSFLRIVQWYGPKIKAWFLFFCTQVFVIKNNVSRQCIFVWNSIFKVKQVSCHYQNSIN